MKKIMLKCPKCGETLQTTPDHERVRVINIGIELKYVLHARSIACPKCDYPGLFTVYRFKNISDTELFTEYIEGRRRESRRRPMAAFGAGVGTD